MSMRRELLSKAVRERFSELCDGERIPQRTTPEFDETAGVFIAQLRERLAHAPSTKLTNSLTALGVPDSWVESDSDCCSSLRQLSLGERFEPRRAQPPPVAPFLQALNACRREPEQRFQLLNARYACPLNFVLPTETEIREHILERLMVPDRVRIESASIVAINADDFLLRLNLITLHAALMPDLRFLDTANYYYEVLPATWRPHGKRGWLLLSYFGLYASALAKWL
jgi:hypothetical protein